MHKAIASSDRREHHAITSSKKARRRGVVGENSAPTTAALLSRTPLFILTILPASDRLRRVKGSPAPRCSSDARERCVFGGHRRWGGDALRSGSVRVVSSQVGGDRDDARVWDGHASTPPPRSLHPRRRRQSGRERFALVLSTSDSTTTRFARPRAGTRNGRAWTNASTSRKRIR